MNFLIAAGRRSGTNDALAAAMCALGYDAAVIHPGTHVRRIRKGDVVLGRIDVRPTLDGVDACLWHLRRLEGLGARVLNGVGCLLAAHDKLHTAIRLRRASLPHPRTAHVQDARVPLELEPPLVLKPRFGSWGADVTLCQTREELDAALLSMRGRRWFRRHGAIAQSLVPPVGRDLRLLVAGGDVVGAIERRAAPGEWRTNVALGATRHSVVPPEDARALARAAVAAVDGDLVGVDLLPHEGGWVVLELNGAVDFTSEYSFPGRDVFADVAVALTTLPAVRPRQAASAG
jgi:RimK family alpha-L-glutamate ligase